MTTKDAPPDESGTVNPLVSALRDKLPPVLWRHMWPEYKRLYGLPFCAGTLANKNHRGDGPPARCLARRIFYERDSFLAWLSTIPVTDAGRAKGNGQ